MISKLLTNHLRAYNKPCLFNIDATDSENCVTLPCNVWVRQEFLRVAHSKCLLRVVLSTWNKWIRGCTSQLHFL
ncbi:unnamed protein product [Hermetia illucens]|uniref:Uncharacterized protein n=1 Tax=Hermetia illucens TaxID=343691 RepID=A0A7R8UDQ4_HERIL|nr:unnamed protein product [Hermetia illucens]